MQKIAKVAWHIRNMHQDASSTSLAKTRIPIHMVVAQASPLCAWGHHATSRNSAAEEDAGMWGGDLFFNTLLGFTMVFLSNLTRSIPIQSEPPGSASAPKTFEAKLRKQARSGHHCAGGTFSVHRPIPQWFGHPGGMDRSFLAFLGIVEHLSLVFQMEASAQTKMAKHNAHTALQTNLLKRSQNMFV